MLSYIYQKYPDAVLASIYNKEAGWFTARGYFTEEEQRFDASTTVRLSKDSQVDLNQYQGGMCISGRLTTTERTPRHLISPLGPNWVGTDSAV